MTPETFIALRAAQLAPEEQVTLLRMQDGDARACHLFTAAELARLRFTRWLHQTGRIRPCAPVPVEVDAWCTALLAEPASSQPALPPLTAAGRASQPTPVNFPVDWVAWAAKHGIRRADDVKRGE